MAASIPPMTTVPMTAGPAAPAPLAMASGTHAEDEREGRHQDRPQAQPRAFQGAVVERPSPARTASSRTRR